MKLALMTVLFGASLCYGQEQGDFNSATSNVMVAQYPKVDIRNTLFEAQMTNLQAVLEGLRARPSSTRFEQPRRGMQF